jgi:hypothetical protein
MSDKNGHDASGAPDRRQGARSKAYFIGGGNFGAKAKPKAVSSIFFSVTPEQGWNKPL